MKESLADDFIEKINTLQKKFESDAEIINVEKGTFDARNMYVLEGTISNMEVYSGKHKSNKSK